MRTRTATLVFEEVQSSDASTKTIDINIVDPISAFAFAIYAQNGATNNRNNPLARCITKIEVVDGSEVISSMSFEQLQALEWYKTGNRPLLQIDEGAADWTTMGASLLFGRYLWDKDFAFVPANYTNPQLKITWNLAAIRAVQASTAWATGTLKLTVYARVMEQMAGVPARLLAAKEIQSWTSGTSGDRHIDLPLDYPYRFIMLRTWVEGNDTNENISNIKISADTDKYIMMDRQTKDFAREMGRVFGQPAMFERIAGTTNDTPWLACQDETVLALTPSCVDVIPIANWVNSGRFLLTLEDYSSSPISTDNEVLVYYTGLGFHATIPIPFGIGDDPDTWFDPAPYGKLEAILTEAAAAACSVVIEQVR